MKMRVLHVTPYFAPAFVYGGPPRSILGLCRALGRMPIDLDVFTTTANGPEELPPAVDEPRVVDGVRARYFPRSSPRRLWNASGLGRALTAALPTYDLVHIHGLWHRPGWQAARAARRLGVPYVISPRGMLEPEALAIKSKAKAVVFRAVERRNLERAAWIHATSLRELETLLPRRFGPPVIYVPNGVEVDELTSVDPRPTLRALGLGDDEPFVLFLGRIHPIKRIDLLVAAMQAVKTRGIRVVVAGPDEQGHRAALEPLFASARVPVTWTGAVDAPRKADLLAAARALVLCSDSESFGLAAAEAMAARLPVVVTRTCPWEEIEREGAGRWVPQDARAIGAALDGILADRDRARAMGARGHALIVRRYTWPAIAATIADHYRAAIERRRASTLARSA